MTPQDELKLQALEGKQKERALNSLELRELLRLREKKTVRDGPPKKATIAALIQRSSASDSQ